MCVAELQGSGFGRRDEIYYREKEGFLNLPGPYSFSGQ
jgi:hypothetical protein